MSIFLWRWALQGGEAASVVSSSIHADVDVSLLVAPARVCWRGQRALGGAANPLASRRPLEVRAAIASRHLILILILILHGARTGKKMTKVILPALGSKLTQAGQMIGKS